MVLFTLQDSLFAQLADLRGKTTAVYLQIVSKLLSVIGDPKGIVSLLLDMVY